MDSKKYPIIMEVCNQTVFSKLLRPVNMLCCVMQHFSSVSKWNTSDNSLEFQGMQFGKWCLDIAYDGQLKFLNQLVKLTNTE